MGIKNPTVALVMPTITATHLIAMIVDFFKE